MKEDKTAVTRGAGSQRTHCLKGSRDIHTWTRKKQMSAKVSGQLDSSLVGVVGDRICYWTGSFSYPERVRDTYSLMKNNVEKMVKYNVAIQV